MKVHGTAGVATNPGANMFGFGPDSNPEYANNFNDEVAAVGLTQQTIIGNKNQTQIQDDKAKKFMNDTKLAIRWWSLFHRYYRIGKDADTHAKLPSLMNMRNTKSS